MNTQKVYTALVRTVRTFVAGFVGYLLLSLGNAQGVTSLAINQKLLYAAAIAGVTAVMNLTTVPTKQ